MNNESSIIIEVDGKAVAKGRGRVAVVNGKGRVFTPAATRSYEAALRYAATQAMIGREPLEGPVELFVHVYIDYPKSLSKKKLAEAVAGIIRPCTKPDIDNYVKSAMDGLNTIVFKDDNQVVSLHAHKVYRSKPALRIEVRHREGNGKIRAEDLI